jgi:hypothetical protein
VLASAAIAANAATRLASKRILLLMVSSLS